MAFVCAAMFAGGVFIVIPLRMDMAGFLPRGHDAGSRFLLREVQQGVAGTVIMAGIDNAPEPELARLSMGLRNALAQDRQFVTVANGAFSIEGDEALRRIMFQNRYVLAPDAASRDFRPTSLRQSFGRLLDDLNSESGAPFSGMLLRDPTGAFLDLARSFSPDAYVGFRQGVWFAPEQTERAPRALLLIRTRAAGMDLPHQASAQKAIRGDFMALHPKEARLLLSGPGVFAQASAGGMRHDIDTISAASLLLVIGILYWRFRSLWMLAAIGVPFLLSLGAGMIAVRAVFGYVHGVAFGFGMTMLGVSLDYPVLLVGHRDRGEGPEATLRRIGRSMRIGVATAVLGLTGMMFCGLTGLAQLGVFAAAGLLTAAFVTLYIMPKLIVAADLAPNISGPSRILARMEQWRQARAICLVPVLISVGVIVWYPPAFDVRLTALSPIPDQLRQLDTAFRRDLGVPDASLLVAVSDVSAEGVLERETALEPAVAALRAQGALAGAQSATRLLPAAATQRSRAATLPDPATLKAAVDEARRDLPFRANAFDGFTADVAMARQSPPVIPQDFHNTPLAAALSPLLFERDGRWWGLLLPEDVRDRVAVTRAFENIPNVMVLDFRQEMDGLSAHYLHRTIRWMAVGCILAIAVLVLGLREIRRVARVLGVVMSVIVTMMGAASLAGVPLTLVHLVALQFVLGVTLDYALFFARPQLDDAERARTMRTLLICNAMTVMTFGMLALCHTMVLRHIGATVAPGVLLAMIYGFLLAGERPAIERTNAS